jgi:hypothetical protein
MTRLSFTNPAVRSLAVALVCLAPLAVAPAGCKLFRKTPLQSTVNMSDPRTAGQLLDGFYGVEAGAWRWTARQFSIKLKTPAGAARKGATLRVLLTVPPAVIERSAAITLSASLEGLTLAPETYSAAGQYTYRRDVPASQLGGAEATVSFQLDKSMTPGGQDQRDLGVVVSTIALESK